MATGPVPRFPVGKSLIKERGWDRIDPHGDLHGRKLIPVGDHGAGDGCVIPVPVPRYPAPLHRQTAATKH